MTQTEGNRIRQLYTMDNLPVLQSIDSGLSAGTVYTNEPFSRKMASSFWRVKKSRLSRERGLNTLVDYTRGKKCCYLYWRTE